MEIDQIIAGLSKAERAALASATDVMSNHGGYPFFTVRHTGDPWPMGIAQFMTLKTDRLTETGLAVRARILENGDGR